MAASILSLGMLTARAFWMVRRRVGLDAGSVPPDLTAMVMSLAIRANCFAMRFQRANIVCFRTSKMRPMGQGLASAWLNAGAHSTGGGAGGVGRKLGTGRRDRSPRAHQDVLNAFGAVGAELSAGATEIATRGATLALYMLLNTRHWPFSRRHTLRYSPYSTSTPRLTLRTRYVPW